MRRTTTILAGVLLLLAASLPAVARAQSVAYGPSPSREEVVAEIVRDAELNGLDPAYLVSVAECESGLDQAARGRWGEVGVFQFMPVGGIWQAMPDAALGYTPWDWQANIDAAAWAFAHGYSRYWSCA